MNMIIGIYVPHSCGLIRTIENTLFDFTGIVPRKIKLYFPYTFTSVFPHVL